MDRRPVKDLMRRTTIAMTADVYACTMRGSQADAVRRLPGLTPREDKQVRATGTDDSDSVLASCLARECTEGRNEVRRGGDSDTSPEGRKPLLRLILTMPLGA